MNPMDRFITSASANPKRIVYPEGADKRIIIAAREVKDRGLAKPILVGKPEEIMASAVDANISLDGIEITGIHNEERVQVFAADYSSARDMKESIARRLVRKPLAFGGMMVRMGFAD